jgi:TATA-binding protein-associated factor Taf7
MTACRWASPRVEEVALASAAVIRALPAARCALRVAQPTDSGTVDVVEVLLVDVDVGPIVVDVLLVDEDEEEELVDDDELLEDDDEELVEEDDDEELELLDELDDDDDEVVPAAKVIDLVPKDPKGVGWSTRR